MGCCEAGPATHYSNTPFPHHSITPTLHFSTLLLTHAHLRRPSRPGDERAGVEPRLDAAPGRNPRSRIRPDRQEGPRSGHGLPARVAAWPRRPRRRDANRALREADTSARGLAFAGAGLGADARAARVVPRNGGGGGTGADQGPRRVGKTFGVVGARWPPHSSP